MDQEQQEFVHKIDNRLAVLEALFEQHANETNKHDELQAKKLDNIQEELSNLKVRVAGISGGVSALVVGLAKLFGGL
jgi:two-component sensor histidine kinase